MRSRSAHLNDTVLRRIDADSNDRVIAVKTLKIWTEAGKITLGPMNQILNAFAQFRSSFQYLVNSWPSIVELISIYKRLRAFENSIGFEPEVIEVYVRA